jgi:hypothetical protein
LFLNLTLAEGVSRPTSPTTHLRQVYVPPLQMRKRKSLGRRVLESFREQKYSSEDSDTEGLVNKVVVERYLKNNLSDKNNNTNLNIYVNETEPKLKLSRRTTSVQRSVVSSFLMKKKSSNLITSFREINNLGYEKQVSKLSKSLIVTSYSPVQQRL